MGRLLMCFNPIVDGDDDELGSDLASPPSSGNESNGGRRNKRVRRSLYAAAKAAFFKTSLLKKSWGDQNSKQDFVRLSSSLSSKSKKLVKSMKKNFSYKACWEPQDIDLRTNSNSSSLLSSNLSRHNATSSLSSSSSSSSSSFSANSRSGSNRDKRSDSLHFEHNMSSNNRQKSMKRDCARECVHNYNFTLEMSLFLVCLGVLVFWGKAFAIVTCTSTWLFFAPARRRLRKVDSTINDVA